MNIKKIILDLIYGADWYFTCSGWQNEYDSDLQLEELFIDGKEKEELLVKRLIGIVLSAIEEVETRLDIQVKHRTYDWWLDQLFAEVKAEEIAEEIDSLEDTVG